MHDRNPGRANAGLASGRLLKDTLPVTERAPMREAALERNTKETRVKVRVDLDEIGRAHV